MRLAIVSFALLVALCLGYLWLRALGADPGVLLPLAQHDAPSGAQAAGASPNPVEDSSEVEADPTASSRAKRQSTESQGGVDPQLAAAVPPPAQRSRRLQVVSQVDGRPISGVTVEVGGKNAERSSGDVTDKKGRARVQRNPNVSYYFRRSGYLHRLLHASELQQAAPAFPTDGDMIVVELRPQAKISGSIAFAPKGHGGGPTPRAPHEEVKGVRAPQGFVLIREERPDGPRRLVATRNISGRGITGRGGHPWTLEGDIADLAPDGSWSLDVSIPYDVDALHDLLIEHAYADGGRRPVGAVPLLRPGDVLVVQDDWQSEEPLRLAFKGENALAFARNGLLLLWRPESGGTREQPEVSLRLDGNGAARVQHLPAGAWEFALHMERPGFPLSWLPSGSFLRKGGELDEALTWEGTVVEVLVKEAEYTPGAIVTVGIVPNGAALQRGRRPRRREKWIIPTPPDGGVYDFVALRRTAGMTRQGRPSAQLRVLVGGSRTDEVLRLPFDRSQSTFELLLPSPGTGPATGGEKR